MLLNFAWTRTLKNVNIKYSEKFKNKMITNKKVKYLIKKFNFKIRAQIWVVIKRSTNFIYVDIFFTWPQNLYEINIKITRLKKQKT